jgi:hypothetical protein
VVSTQSTTRYRKRIFFFFFFFDFFFKGTQTSVVWTTSIYSKNCETIERQEPTKVVNCDDNAYAVHRQSQNEGVSQTHSSPRIITSNLLP